MSVSAALWQVGVGAQITASLADPPGGLHNPLGARVEVPVTRAIVSPYQGAALSGGVWTVTLDGVLSPGFFNFVWLTSDAEPPEYEVTIPIQILDVGALPDGTTGIGGADYPDVDVAQITPSLDEVARLERTRTVDSAGNDVATFTSDTRPTDAEVELIIDQAVSDVTGAFPSQFDPAHYGEAKKVVILYAAMLVEGSYYKEQALARGGLLPWENEYNTAQKMLEESIIEDRNQNNLLGVMEPRSTVILT